MAALPVGMGLHQKRAVCAVFRDEVHEIAADDRFRIVEQLVMEAVEQVVVVALVEAELRSFVDADAERLRLTLQSPVSEQEFRDLAARSAEVAVDIVEGGAVVVVGDADGVVAAGLVHLGDRLRTEPATF